MRRYAVMAVLPAVVLGGTAAFALLPSPAAPVYTVTPARTEPATAPTRAEAKPPSTPTVVVDRPTWRRADKDWLGRQPRAFAFEVLSDHKVTAWQRQAQPILVVRCVANRTEAFVFIESAAQMEPEDENHSVRVRFDDDAEVTERWPDSADHDALFAPDSSAFTRRLLSARSLQFRYKPHNASRVVASFNVSGLSDLVAPLARQCALVK